MIESRRWFVLVLDQGGVESIDFVGEFPDDEGQSEELANEALKKCGLDLMSPHSEILLDEEMLKDIKSRIVDVLKESRS